MKKEWKINRNLAAVAICLVVMLICGAVISVVKTDRGRVNVKEVVISPYGEDLAMTVYLPNSALETDENGEFVHQNSYPAVLVNSGYTDDRSCIDNVAIELAHRGFVVAQYDMYGHGHSDVITNRGYGNVPDPFAGDMSQLGAYDVLEYLRSLDYVDQTRIGMVGHSLGGSAVGSMVATTAGFYTLQDELLNLLHDEFGVSVSAGQVAQQDADAVANASLTENELEVYEQRTAAITEQYNMGVRSAIVLDADPGFGSPKEVEVAGNTVWRDAQANFALFANISGGLSKGATNPDYCLSSELSLKFLSQDTSVKRDTWYSLNLSDGAERKLSTEVADFYTSPSDATIQELAANHSLRALIQPWGWHAFTNISGETATAAVQFFMTTLAYNNGDIAPGSEAASALSLSTGEWKIKEIASGIAFIALLAMVLPLVNLVLSSRPFESMKHSPIEPVNSKVTPALIVTTLIAILVPVFTYSKGVGWAMNVQASPFSTIQIATQTAFWSFVMALLIFAVIVLKYFVYDKKHTNVSFADMYGLRICKKDLAKALVLGLIVFAVISVILTVFYGAFHEAKMRITPLGKILYAALADHQYYSYFLYALYFFPFYFVNSMMVNASRFKNMSETKNMYVVAAINCSGMLVLSLVQIIFGLYLKGSTVIPTIPGSSATIYNLPFFAVTLFIATIFSRKLYLKTGSSVPGAIINVLVFTFPAIQSYSYCSL